MGQKQRCRVPPHPTDRRPFLLSVILGLDPRIHAPPSTRYCCSRCLSRLRYSSFESSVPPPAFSAGALQAGL